MAKRRSKKDHERRRLLSEGYIECPGCGSLLRPNSRRCAQCGALTTSTKRALKAVAETKIGAQQLLACIDKGARSVRELSRSLNESQEFVRRCLHYLKEIGEITIDRKARPHRTILSK